MIIPKPLSSPNLSGCEMTQSNVATQIFLEAGENNVVISLHNRHHSVVTVYETNDWSDPFSDDQE